MKDLFGWARRNQNRGKVVVDSLARKWLGKTDTTQSGAETWRQWLFDEPKDNKAVRTGRGHNGFSLASVGLNSTAGFTARGWARLDAVDPSVVQTLFLLLDGSFNFLGVNVAAGTRSVTGFVGGRVTPGVTVMLGRWFYWALTVDGTATDGIKLYIAQDNAATLAAAVTHTATAAVATAGSLYIADSSFYEEWDGALSMFRISSGVMSKADLETDMFLVDPTVTAGLYGAWKFDASLIADSLLDSSGNGRTLTQVGAPTVDKYGPPNLVSDVPITGALSGTLDAVGVASTGIVPIDASLTGQLGLLALASGATTPVVAALAQAVAPLGLVSAATAPAVGALGKTGASLALAATGVSVISGAAGIAPGNVVLSAIGWATRAGASVSLTGASLAGEAVAAIVASGGGALAVLTASVTGVSVVKGLAASTMATASVVASGWATRGAVSVGLAPLTRTLAGTAPVSATASATLASASMVGVGWATQALSAPALAPASVVAAGAAPVVAQGAAVLGGLAGSLAGASTVHGSAPIVLAGVSLSASATPVLQGALAGALDGLSVDLTAVSPVVGTADIALAGLSGAAGAAVPINADMAAALAGPSLVATAEAPARGQFAAFLDLLLGGMTGVAPADPAPAMRTASSAGSPTARISMRSGGARIAPANVAQDGLGLVVSRNGPPRTSAPESAFERIAAI